MTRRTRYFGALAALLSTTVTLISNLPVFAQSCVPGTFAANPSVALPAIPSGVTHFQIANGSGANAYAAINVPISIPNSVIEDGCTTSVSNIVVIDITTPGAPTNPVSVVPFGGSSNAGYFVLLANHIYEIQNSLPNPFPQAGAPALQNCLQGLIVSFNQQSQCPACCPLTSAWPTQFVAGPSLPNGVNGAEVTLNLPGTANNVAVPAGLNESCDITCVNGANTKIGLAVAPSISAKSWSYDNSIPVTSTITTENSWVNIAGQCDNNCNLTTTTNNGTTVTTDRIGVYPYGCSICNTLPDPDPPCKGWFANNGGSAGAPGCTPGTASSNLYQFCAQRSTASCNFQRSPDPTKIQTQQFGGVIAFVYKGPITVPVTCTSTSSGPGAPTPTSSPSTPNIPTAPTSPIGSTAPGTPVKAPSSGDYQRIFPNIKFRPVDRAKSGEHEM